MRKLEFILGLGMLLAQACIAQETPEERLVNLGIELKKPSDPIANYVNVVKVGNTLYISGKGPILSTGEIIQGKLGESISLAEGQRASKITAINLISVLKYELGKLSRVKKIIKLNGMVNSTPEFTQHPKVINGASDLLVEVFGETVGKHARVVAGMNSLPFNIPVEIDLIVEINE